MSPKLAKSIVASNEFDTTIHFLLKFGWANQSGNRNRQSGVFTIIRPEKIMSLFYNERKTSNFYGGSLLFTTQREPKSEEPTLNKILNFFKGKKVNSRNWNSITESPSIGEDAWKLLAVFKRPLSWKFCSKICGQNLMLFQVSTPSLITQVRIREFIVFLADINHKENHNMYYDFFYDFRKINLCLRKKMAEASSRHLKNY